MKLNLPSISVIIPVYNSQKTIKSCLDSIKSQIYPKKFIEIILTDGGSSDKTKKISQKYGVKFISVASVYQGPEYNRAYGAHQSSGEVLLFLDHDNILPHRLWLQKMIQPFQDDPTIVGVETLHYCYDRNDNILGRYFSLFGINDPLPYYLGKADRLSYIFNNPQLYGVYKYSKVVDCGGYFSIDFNQKAIPTLGSNGFMIKRLLLFSKAKTDFRHFFHIDVNVDLIRQGYNRYAFIKDCIYHKTNERGILDYLKRRMLFVEKYHIGAYGINKQTERRYSVYENQDFIKLFLYIIFCLTFVKPIIDSIRGYRKKPDFAWFLHPIICFCLVVSYTLVIIKHYVLPKS